MILKADWLKRAPNTSPDSVKCLFRGRGWDSSSSSSSSSKLAAEQAKQQQQRHDSWPMGRGRSGNGRDGGGGNVDVVRSMMLVVAGQCLTM